jgi:PAS domain S-box-containing protein
LLELKEQDNRIINTDDKHAKEFSLNNNSLTRNKNLDKDELDSITWLEKYQEIIKNISDLIIEIDLKGDIAYISPHVYDIAGYISEELIGKNIFEYIKYEDISKIQNIMQKALTSKKLLIIEINARHKDGHYILFSIRCKIYKFRNETRYLVILRDISK